ncbi:SMI1/KNR4 family protein [Microscilla marina]|uniref:Knr4/Smi1-like domain-containing protein n=1 Tax=Microscilla marina ATCC 23134 TaxID=313606 RepID=A1ZZZ9_MICM2|nr:SMI1/KNR4 family protein [Microscilla marina]EAY24041.1 hypothetical protein M23134_00933 [Microscilla marina ATCC 23134]
MNYTSDLEKIKQEIDRHPLLEVITYEVAPPASKEQIKSIEQKYNIVLDQGLKDFYEQANGCCLHWQLIELSEDEYDAKVYDKFGDYEPDLEDDEENPFAQIKINSLEDCFLKDSFSYDDSHDYIFQFKGNEYIEHEFSKKLKILDEYSTFSSIAYLCDTEFESAPLVMLSSHYSNWWNSRLTDFATYWKILMQSRGIIEIRNDILGATDGHNLPTLQKFDSVNPQLFA